jgi:O-antigen/teichoic acid export membrane protein
MGKIDLAFSDSFLTTMDSSHEAMLSTLYSRIVSSDFIRKVGETFLTRICLIGIGLATSVIIARILGPEGRGLYAVALAISAFGVQFGNLGFHASNTYYVARDKRLLPALVGNTILLSFAVGGFITVLLWVIFSRWPHLAPLDGVLFILSLIWIPLGLASLLLQNLLLGIQEVHAYNKIELGTKLFGVGLLSLLVFIRTVTVEAFFSTGLVALVISSVWALRRLNPHLIKPLHGSVALLKQNVGYGLKAYLAALFSFSVVRADLLMTKYILGAEQTGYYSVAASMAEFVYMLPVVVATILFPKLSALTDMKEQWVFTKRVAVATGTGMLFLLAGAGVLAKPLIIWLYGDLFLPSVPAFLWLLPGVFFLGVEIVVVQFLNSIGFPKLIVGVWGLTSLLNIGLNMWAIPKYGITGASIVSSLSYFIVCGLILWITWQTRQTHGSG